MSVSRPIHVARAHTHTQTHVPGRTTSTISSRTTRPSVVFVRLWSVFVLRGLPDARHERSHTKLCCYLSPHAPSLLPTLTSLCRPHSRGAEVLRRSSSSSEIISAKPRSLVQSVVFANVLRFHPISHICTHTHTHTHTHSRTIFSSRYFLLTFAIQRLIFS
jgi:hypothetical protein